MKRFLPLLLSSLLLLPLAAIGASAAANQVSFTVTATAVDADVTASSVVVFPNDTDTPRVISSVGYNFRAAKLLIFNKDGKLIEAGSELYANEDGTNGSPQLSVTIPAHGFMVGFGSGADSQLLKCYNTAFEGAMLYNATMSIRYDVNGSYDASTKKISISYAEPEPVSEDATKFLIVGNSATYFNGTPIKFKGLCLAAGLDVDVTYCTYGSSNLSQFADESHSYGQALRSKLASGAYDYVVLQDAGGATAEATEAALDVLVPLVRDSGAKPVLYMRYSDKTSKDARLANNLVHYNTYTAMAEKFDTVAAPAAVAYYYCTKNYEDIELYADDLSHHSAAGSYLIACTWLRAFMGVSPVGNAYTANLDAETVKILQKLALQSCDEAFDPDAISQSVFVDEDGTKYINVAHKRPYTVNGSVYTGNWTDADENGNPLGKWTDGFSTKNGGDTLVGCWKGSTVEAIIDLGGIVPIKRVATDLFGNSGWGISDPGAAKVQFYVSTDGETFALFGDAVSEDGECDGGDGWTRKLFTYTSEGTVDAAFVKVVYKIGGNYCWVSEIEAFGRVQSGEEPPKQDDSSADDPASDAPSASESGSSSAASESSRPTAVGDTGILALVLLAVLVVAGGLVTVRVRKVRK